MLWACMDDSHMDPVGEYFLLGCIDKFTNIFFSKSFLLHSSMTLYIAPFKVYNISTTEITVHFSMTLNECVSITYKD